MPAGAVGFLGSNGAGKMALIGTLLGWRHVPVATLGDEAYNQTRSRKETSR
jgi:ABC-type multidrug transport system ATPase subunit